MSKKKKELTLVSLGAGVQSSCMSFMLSRGELEPWASKGISGAIFSDTGAEPREVYDYLDYLEKSLPFPVYRVMHKEGLTKELEDHVSGRSNRSGNPPFFTAPTGLLRRQCTADFKIDPINKKVRELLGFKKGERVKDAHVNMLIGISLDEIQRMKPSRTKWITHHWPLVDARMNRNNCLKYMERMDYREPPRSACVYCPYHSDHEWRRIRDTDPEGWQEAIRVDKLVRDGMHDTNSKLYVHRSLKPLDEVDLSTEEDRGQSTFFEAWNAECEGMCGM